jgi:hemoglobin/transferrin/lactoferrin receptor protein
VTDHLELTLAIHNATDIDYRVHGSGVNEPGINLVLGGRLSW